MIHMFPLTFLHFEFDFKHLNLLKAVPLKGWGILKDNRTNPKLEVVLYVIYFFLFVKT